MGTESVPVFSIGGWSLLVVGIAASLEFGLSGLGISQGGIKFDGDGVDALSRGVPFGNTKADVGAVCIEIWGSQRGKIDTLKVFKDHVQGVHTLGAHRKSSEDCQNLPPLQGLDHGCCVVVVRLLSEILVASTTNPFWMIVL